jgi:hypothetical protein
MGTWKMPSYNSQDIDYVCGEIESLNLSGDDLWSFLADLLREIDARNEARAEAAYEALQASGGPDDSAYRTAMRDAGRGHLLK